MAGYLLSNTVAMRIEAFHEVLRVKDERRGEGTIGAEIEARRRNVRPRLAAPPLQTPSASELPQYKAPTFARTT